MLGSGQCPVVSSYDRSVVFHAFDSGRQRLYGQVAFVMDNLLRKIGLSGRSFVPMLIGFGCSVPAIMATRTLSSERDRRLTIMLIPFMSCSAKLPIYAMFTAAFFTEYRALVMISLYLLGIFIGILCGFVMKRRMFDGEPIPFVMELPGIGCLRRAV